MIRLTWEWLGQGPALDLANTVAIEDGAEHDLIASPAEYDRWARAEAPLLREASLQLLEEGRADLMDLRTAVRQVLAAVAAGERPDDVTVEQLNRASRKAPQWLELDTADALSLHEESSTRELDRLLARYARSAMEVVALERSRLRQCPAPSCGMFYLSTRQGQRWCSTQCGTRARVARHYHSRRRTPGRQRTG